MTLRVKLEIVKYGNEQDITEIGRLDINNLGRLFQGTSVCDYQIIEISPDGSGEHKRTVQHDREDGAWELVRKVLNRLDI